METILIFTVCTLLNVVCFLIGAKVGQKVVKGEPIELPSVNPMKAYREAQDKKQADKEAEKLERLMHNIEAYDGTSAGQKDVN